MCLKQLAGLFGGGKKSAPQPLQPAIPVQNATPDVNDPLVLGAGEGAVEGRVRAGVTADNRRKGVVPGLGL